MPQLIQCQTVRQTVIQMPVLDTSGLTTRRQRLLAHLQLSVIAAGYVWGCGKDVVKSLPPCVAVPLHALSQQLGLKPVICHANRSFANWTLVNPDGPFTIENMRSLYPLLNAGEEGEFFTSMITLTELTFAPALELIVGVLAALDGGTDKEAVITDQLHLLAQVVKDTAAVVGRLPEKLNWNTFVEKIMLYSTGWGQSEDSPIPDGLIFEGVSDTPIKAGSDTGGQSCILQVLDALLGITPSEEASRKIILELRDQMLPEHQKFVETIEQRENTLSDFVEKSTNTDLRDAYKGCVKAVADFRTTHYKIVAKYLTQAVKKKAESAEDKETREMYEAMDFTDVRDMLRNTRQSTLKKELADPPQQSQAGSLTPGESIQKSTSS